MPGLKKIIWFSILPLCIYAQNFRDLTLLQSSKDKLIYEIEIKNFEFREKTDADGNRIFLPYFLYGKYPDTPEKYPLPSRMLKFAVPHNGDLTIKLVSQTLKKFNDVILEQKSAAPDIQLFNPQKKLFESGLKTRFRDFMIREVQLNPVSYDEQTRTVTLVQKMVIQVEFSGEVASNTTFRSSGVLDKIYPNTIVNFDQAKNWQLKKKRVLAKGQDLGSGTFYGIKIEEDGIYKVTASLLNNNGIDTGNLSIDALQMYNNGGHQLTFSTTASAYNPPFTQEVAIRVFDLNSNNLFDGSDYFLFYGKSLNSWFWEDESMKFIFQKHNWATTNMYYLSTNGNSGKRIQDANLNSIAGARVQDFYVEHFHYENDSYNLLHSGPDWYGHRFFGKSANFTIEFNLDEVYQAGDNTRVEMQLKGGSGVHYGDDLYYRYDFDIFLNNNPLNFAFNENSNRFYFSARVNNTIEINNAWISNGVNRFTFNFSSTQDESNAYLDYFSIYYPRVLNAENNYLNFYASPAEVDVSYNLRGFGNLNDLYLFDVTDPVTPLSYLSGQSVNGSFQVDKESSVTGKNFIAFSLSSSKIKSVPNLVPYTPRKNLLSTGNSADFIIITRNSLLDYGEQIADLRDHLKTEVVSMEDINFYFNNGVQDPVAIRNFIRYAYYNWQAPSISYLLLLGDGHYDYRNISVSDSMIVPTFQIYAEKEIAWSGPESRETDIFYGQLETNDNDELQLNIKPSIAVGRIPVENELDAEVMIEKLKIYEENPVKDGWQLYLTFVGDDEVVSNQAAIEWQHQRDAERLANLSGLNKFLKKKIYLSAYDEVPGGLGRLKPVAAQELIDQINRGTLILNYTGHGSPTQWAHETVFNFDRDYSKINNEYKFPFVVAATCDFGLFDDPNKVSFTEALIWKEKAGAIGVLAASRLVYSSQNFAFANSFYRNLFPNLGPSTTLGEAYMQALNANSSDNINDQKYHLLADPTMYLADPRSSIQIENITPDTLKALSTINVSASVTGDQGINTNFNGGAIIIVNDAQYENLQTGGTSAPLYNLDGPLIFKGEVSVENGRLQGSFIVPKTIRYVGEPTGKISIYAWDDASNLTAGAYQDNLLFAGSTNLNQENDGPRIDVYFEGQENFSSGDIISANPVLVAEIEDESGLNITGQLGHKMEIQVDKDQSVNIGESFVYNRDSFTEGIINYPLTGLTKGEHSLSLRVFDNLNNKTENQISFSITESDGLVLKDVINYPNPFQTNTQFTFQTNVSGADLSVKIYTISGRLIQTLDGLTTVAGYNSVDWNGVDRDYNYLANGVYLYKVILKFNGQTSEKIEKLVILK